MASDLPQQQDIKTQLPGYTLEQLLHRGRNNLIYAAQRNADQLPVIIKLARTDAEDADAPERLHHEYQIAGHSNNPHLLKALAFEQTTESCAMIMPKLAGQALEDYLGNRSLGIDEFLQLSIELANAVHALHNQRILHKDLNPRNIIINEQRHLTLIDFGISAQLASGQTKLPPPGSIEGSLAYISPEQTGRTQSPIDLRADLYSVGIIFFKMLSGDLPFHATDSMEMIHCHIAKQAADLLSLRSDLPAILAQITNKLMAKSPDDRYQSAASLLADLQLCQQLKAAANEIPSFELDQQSALGRLHMPDTLIGRDQEIQAINLAYQRCERAPENNEILEVVFVSGEPGTGKSSLIKHLEKRVRASNGILVNGSFEQLQTGTPYAGFIAALNDFFSHLLTEPADILESWQQRLRAALGPQASLLSQLIPMLECIIGPQDSAAKNNIIETENQFLMVFYQLLGTIASADTPLVIHLKDAQWADSASLNLIRTLTAIGCPHLLIIISYSSEDDEKNSAVKQLHNDLRNAERAVTSIHLNNLTSSQTAELVAEILQIPTTAITDITPIIQEKTNGNITAVIDFMQSLQAQALLSYQMSSANQRCWQWNIEGIKACQASNNVVDIIAHKINGLLGAEKMLVDAIACYGGHASYAELHTLLTNQQAHSDDAKQVDEHLIKLQQAGIIAAKNKQQQIINLTKETFAQLHSITFFHEKLQHSIYSQISEKERNLWHLKIARTINEITDNTDNRIYELVNHYNNGRTHITDQTERWHVSQLNLAAGKKAKQAAAYSIAPGYFRIGSEMIDDSNWDNNHSACFEFFSCYAEIASMATLFETADRLYPTLHQKARNIAEHQRVFLLQIEQAQQQSLYKNAVDIGKQALSTLDYSMPDDDESLEKEINVNTTKALSLINNLDWQNNTPTRIHDERSAYAIALMASMASSAFAASLPKILDWISASMALISLQNGYSQYSPYGYICFASNILRGRLQDYATAYDFGAYAIKLADTDQQAGLRGRAYQVFGYALAHWKRPYAESSQYLTRAYELCSTSGDIAIAAQSAYMYITDMIIAGKPLKRLKKEAEHYEEFIKRYHRYYYDSAYKASAMQAINHLLGLTNSSASFDASDFKEAVYLQERRQVLLFVSRYYAARIRACYLFGLHKEAINYLPHADYIARVFGGMAILPETLFYMALNMAAVYREISKDEAKTYLQHINDYLEKMRTWADNCPENYAAKMCLLTAEISRLNAQTTQAVQHYQQGIIAAEQHNQPNLQGVGNELCAKFWLEQNAADVAAIYLHKAYTAFKEWGAEAKLESLRASYPQVLNTATKQLDLHDTPHRQTTWVSSQKALDFSAIMKATRAISGEIRLEKLLKLLLRVLAENAGAQQAYLLLKQANEFVLVGEFDASRSDGEVLQNKALKECNDIPKALINLVSRTDETIVLGDTQKDARFLDDFRNHGLSAKSALCMPILSHKQAIGIIYLSNNLLKNAFNEDRLEVLRILASQAATSIENATLYSNLNAMNSELEERVNERTRELEIAHKALLDKAHKAGMAEIATGVLHNIGNILNTVNTSFYTMHNTIKDSKVIGLKKANQLLIENEDKLPEFFSTDPRAKKLVQYYSKLEDQVLKERDEMLEVSERLDQAISNIRDAISAQQNYARQGAYTETVSLAMLIEEAIALYGNSLRKSNIEIEISELPKVNMVVPKAKLVNIFVNLFKNAKEAISDARQTQGAIKISAHRDEEMVHIQVSDSGPGVPQEYVEKLFAHGFTTKRSGHGFGLHSCANDMREMGGSINLKRTNEPGATFILQIPLSSKNQQNPLTH